VENKVPRGNFVFPKIQRIFSRAGCRLVIMTVTRRFGSVRTLPSGKHQARWQGADGKEHHAPQTFATKTAAREWLSTQETDLGRGGWIDPDKGRVTFAVYSTEWLDERADLAPRTVELYQSLLRLHVLPRLGPVELGRLDPEVVRRWRSALLRSKLGKVTIAKSYRLLRTILNTAVEDGKIPANPCRIKRAGIERSPERKTATVEQVFALADVIDPRYRVAVLLAAFAALRFGELGALARRHVDLEAGTVTVTAAAIETQGGHREIGQPKTDSSRRTVTLPSQIADELRAHIEQYVDKAPGSLVFVGPKGGPLRRANFHTIWAPAREAVGLDELHFHDLRHTGNTLAAATGASTADLMARMGHSSVRAAMIYQHATGDQDRAIASGLEEMIDQSRADHSRHVPGTNRPILRVVGE
jgi:integrase